MAVEQWFTSAKICKHTMYNRDSTDITDIYTYQHCLHPTEPFKRSVSISQLLALLRKQRKMILCKSELSSEILHVSIFHLGQECLFEDHLPVVSTQSAVAHTVQ